MLIREDIEKDVESLEKNTKQISNTVEKVHRAMEKIRDGVNQATIPPRKIFVNANKDSKE
jgi:archaellum component FlaC